MVGFQKAGGFEQFNNSIFLVQKTLHDFNDRKHIQNRTLKRSSNFIIITRNTTAMDPRHLKSRISQRVGYQSNKKLLHHYQHSKNQLDS